MSFVENLSSPEKREKFLLVVAGILLFLVIVPTVYVYFGAESAKLSAQRSKLRTDLEKLEKETQNADEINKRLEKLASISLPPNESVAQSVYRNWLLDQASASGLREIKIDQGAISPFKEFYKKYTISLHARASLEQLATFLGRFQRTDHLQLIRSVSIRPLKESREMDVSLKVEALALRQAKPATTLTMRDKSNALSMEAERKMLKTIVDRALFSTYVPPSAQPQHADAPPPKVDFDQSPYCFVTAVVEVNDKPQVWVDLRTEAKKFKLYEGEMFRLDGVRCFVRKIDYDKVEFEAAGGRYTIKVGKSFAEYE